MVTREKVRINEKFVKAYQIVDCMNWLFVSNDFNPVDLKADERRFFVTEQARDDVLDPKIGAEFVDWIQTEAGAAAAFNFLLKEVDTAGFRWNAPPPTTQAKLTTISSQRTNLANYAHDLRDNYPVKVWPLVTHWDHQTLVEQLLKGKDPDADLLSDRCD